MATELKPSEYLKLAKAEFKGLDSATADNMIKVLRQKWTDGIYQILAIPPYMPVKYRARIQNVWVAMVANILFSRASEKISYAERFKLAQKIK